MTLPYRRNLLLPVGNNYHPVRAASLSTFNAIFSPLFTLLPCSILRLYLPIPLLRNITACVVWRTDMAGNNAAHLFCAFLYYTGCCTLVLAYRWLLFARALSAPLCHSFSVCRPYHGFAVCPACVRTRVLLRGWLTCMGWRGGLV